MVCHHQHAPSQLFAGNSVRLAGSTGRYSRLMRAVALVLVSLVCTAITTMARAEPVALPAFRIDLDQTSVSGLSSGGYMAVQFGVAYSSITKGAGVVAGGPFYCAQGRLDIATRKCSCTGLFAFLTCEVAPGSTQVSQLVSVTQRWANEGLIDPLDRLGAQRVWLFSGSRDSVVPPPVMQDLAAYYGQFIPPERIRVRDDVAAEHAMPTLDFGRACDSLGSPYINDCELDGAGELLAWIYGKLQPPRQSTGRVLEFDQTEFAPGGDSLALGLASSGYAYIPAACETAAANSGPSSGSACRLHIAFHGCKQNVANVGDQFIRQAGYNRWAESNRLIVLYPQTQAKSSNLNACWNWFDFDRNDPNYANQRGQQMRAIRAMVDRIAGRTSPPAAQLPRCFTAPNAEHVRRGRAYGWFFLARAQGSGELLGFGNASAVTTLRQTAPGYYRVGTCS